MKQAIKQCLACVLLSSSLIHAQAQTASFPNRPVTLVVPFPAGGGTDMSARIVAQKLAQKWGVPVQVENKSGVAGIVGSELVARARPDGYTLLVGNVGTLSINPSLYASMPYDRDRAFMPISLMAELPMVLVTPPNFPVKSVAELVALARQHPAGLSYGSSGSGGAPHIAAELFKQATATFILHMPYRGGAPAVADLMAGRVNLSFITVLEASARIKSGQLRALAVTSSTRVSAIPEVPTLAATVAPGYQFISWVGLLAPQGTPHDVVEKISADVRTVLASEDTSKRIVEIGGIPAGNTPAQFGRLIDEERRRYAQMIQERGIKLD